MQVPRYGLPDVTPSVELPPQRLQDQVGAAVANFGGQVSKLGDALYANAERMRIQDAETLARQKDNEFQSSVDQATLGEGGILTLQGRAAMDAAPAALAHLRSMADDVQSSITDRDAARMFGISAGARLNNATQNIYSHVAAERLQWVASTNQGRTELATGDIGLYPNDPTRYQQNIRVIRASQQALGDAQGHSPEQIEADTRTALDKAGQTWLASQPVATAIQLLTGGQMGGPANAAAIWTAIQQQESGGRATSPTSIDGAVGPGQVTPPTFARYAKPGEVITNANDNAAVGQRIVESYAARWPNDPARVAVAYFSGEGNVAPAGSPTPWVRDAHDGNHKFVSSYVADVMGRLGGSTPTSAATDTPLDNVMPANRAALLYQYQAQARAQIGQVAAQQRIEQEATQNQLYSKFVAGSLTFNDVMSSNLPAFGLGSRKEFIDMLQATAGGVNTQPHLFVDLYQRIYRNAGDPQRIDNATQLNSYVTRGLLAPADLDTLRKQIDERDASGNAGEAQLTKQIQDAARRQFMGTDLLPIKDPNGAARLQAFTAWFLQQRDARRAKGENISDWLSSDAPDSPSKVLPTFASSLPEILRAKTAALRTAVAPAPAEGDKPPPLPPILATLRHSFVWVPSSHRYRDTITNAYYDAAGRSVR